MVIDFIRDAGLSAASAALGAVILPNLAASLVGGYGMIAAAGAVSGCFSLALSIGTKFLIHCLVPKKHLENFIENHSLLYFSSLFLLDVGTTLTGVFLASIVMGQAFLPLLGCMALGGLILGLGVAILQNIVGHEPKQNNFALNV